MKIKLMGLITLGTTIISANEWAYLYSDVFKSRYAIASYYLKDCSEIIEIGGYKTPISDFMADKKITVIDPLIVEKNTDLVFHYQGTIDAWMSCSNNYIPKSNYGILLLGFNLIDMSDKAWLYLYDLINMSQVTLIGFSIDWQPSIDQFDLVLKNTNKKIYMRIVLDLSNNDFGDLNHSWPPRTKRVLYFLK